MQRYERKASVHGSGGIYIIMPWLHTNVVMPILDVERACYEVPREVLWWVQIELADVYQRVEAYSYHHKSTFRPIFRFIFVFSF